MQYKKEIAELEKKLQEEIQKNGENTKRAIFLKSTINVYLYESGQPVKYSF